MIGAFERTITDSSQHLGHASPRHEQSRWPDAAALRNLLSDFLDSIRDNFRTSPRTGLTPPIENGICRIVWTSEAVPGVEARTSGSASVVGHIQGTSGSSGWEIAGAGP